MAKITQTIYLIKSYGFSHVFTSGLDLTAATRVWALINKPDARNAETGEVTSVLRELALPQDVLDAATGRVRIPILDGDLDQEGIYDLILCAESPADSGLLAFSPEFQFTVRDERFDLTLRPEN